MKENKSNFRVREEINVPNVYINPKYVSLIEGDIEAFYPLIKKSDFLDNILKAYFANEAGFKKRKELVDEGREEDFLTGKRRSSKQKLHSNYNSY